MVALEARFRDFVAILAAAQGYHVKTVANFNALHRVDAHQRVRDVGIETVKYRLAPAWRDAVGHDGDFRPDGVALFFQTAHQFVQRIQLVGIGTEERVLLDLIPVFDRQRNVAHLGQTAADHDAKFLLQVFLSNGASRHAHRGFTRGGTSAAAIVAEAVLLFVGVVGMAWTEHVLDGSVVLGALIGVFN